MILTAEALDEIRNAVESLEFGEVRITINEKGNYVEITKQERRRISKAGDTKRITGAISVFRNDVN
jgi:hypothetical protein